MSQTNENQDVEMADASTTSILSRQDKAQKSRDIFTCTISKPAFAYAHLELVTSSQATAVKLDELQARSHFTSALQRFLGATGTAISIDILKVQGSDCWVRVPREDLGTFAAAITAWPGVTQDGVSSILQMRTSGNWLGSIVGRGEQHKLWTS